MKRWLIAFALFTIFLSDLSSAVTQTGYSVDISGYEITATNNLEYPITLEITYGRFSQNLSIDEELTILLNLNPFTSQTYVDEFSTMPECEIPFQCSLTLTNYQLFSVHFNESQFNSLNQRLAALEQTSQDHEDRLLATENFNNEIAFWKLSVEETLLNMNQYFDELFTIMSQHESRLNFLEDHETRISSLENTVEEIGDWTSDMDNWRGETTNELLNLGTDVTELFGTTADFESRITDSETRITASESKLAYTEEQINRSAQNIGDLVNLGTMHEERITTLEGLSENLTAPDYWRFMSSTDKKNIICGVAIENHLDSLAMEDLGYECNVKYTMTQSGERTTCRCFRL